MMNYPDEGITLAGRVYKAMKETTDGVAILSEAHAERVACRISAHIQSYVDCANAEMRRSVIKDQEIANLKAEIKELDTRLAMQGEMLAKNKRIGALNLELAEARQALDAQRKKNSHLRKCLRELKERKTPCPISFDVHFEGYLRGVKVCDQDKPLSTPIGPGDTIQTKIDGHGGLVLDKAIIRLKAKNVCASEPSPETVNCRCWAPRMGGKFIAGHDDAVDAMRYAATFIEGHPVIKEVGLCAPDHILIFNPFVSESERPKSGYLIMTPDGMVPEAETSDYAVMCPDCGRISPEHVGGCDACVKTCDRCDHQCKLDEGGVCCDIGGCSGRSEWTPKRKSE